MKYLSLFLLTLSSAFAYENTPFHLTNSGSLLDFAAPVVPSSSSIVDKQVGQIIYDSSSNTFKGLDGSGNWDAMTVPGSSQNVSSTGSGNYHLEGAYFGGATTNTDCTSSPCTLRGAYTGWISSVTRTGSGGYVVNFTAGEFGVAPVCQCNSFAYGTGASACTLYSATTSSISVETVNLATGFAAIDSEVQITCLSLN